MTELNVFDEEELRQIRLAPSLVVSAATFSEPGGAYSVLKEMLAGMTGLVGSLQQNQSQLIKQLFENVDEDSMKDSGVDDLKAMESGSEEQRQELIDQSITTAVAAMQIIEQKGDQADTDAYVSALLNGADAAVNATKTGSFLRFGGERVTEAEAAYVKQLQEALGYQKA